PPDPKTRNGEPRAGLPDPFLLGDGRNGRPFLPLQLPVAAPAASSAPEPVSTRDRTSSSSLPSSVSLPARLAPNRPSALSPAVCAAPFRFSHRSNRSLSRSTA